jgi:hypothetical protein
MHRTLHVDPARQGGSQSAQHMSGLRDRPTDATRRVFVCVPEPCDVSPRAPTPNPGGPEPIRVAQQRAPRGCRSALLGRPFVRYTSGAAGRGRASVRVGSSWGALRPRMLRACSSSSDGPRRSRPTRARAFSLAVSTRPVAPVSTAPASEEGAYGVHYVTNLCSIGRGDRVTSTHGRLVHEAPPGVAC